MPATVHHALGLHMHQPPGSLRLLAGSNPADAEQIIRCYDRVPRYLKAFPEAGRIHVGFSGILLEQLRDPVVVDAYRKWVDIPAMLDAYRETPQIELIGMGYYHPIFPLIPVEDWEDQLISGRQIMEEIFGRAPRGFWPPEMAFCMEMVPALAAAGYQYVLVDHPHVQARDGILDVFKPYVARQAGRSIAVIPRNRDLSNAQESGMDPAWFAQEVRHKVAESPAPDAPRLATTWSDGENGNWFRQLHEESGFFGVFFAPYMRRVQAGDIGVAPVSISEFLAAHPPATEARVRTGAWNVGSTSGFDLRQWTGSLRQREAVETVCAMSNRYWALEHTGRTIPPAARTALDEARTLILEGQTSCFLFWGDDWVPRLYERTDRAAALLAKAEKLVGAKPPPPPRIETGEPLTRRTA
jgi:alpha-amylase/alpha-mannosidase (GH57 family)